eukprot:g1043.t1
MLKNCGLCTAAGKGDVEKVKKKLQSGADSNRKDMRGKFPLMAAAKNGHANVAEVLLAAQWGDRAAPVDQVNNSGSTALHCASWEGHANVVNVLLNFGADRNLKDKDGDTALIIASRNGHLAAAELLVKARADINCKGKDEHTPLTSAVRAGHLRVAKMLIENKADVYQKSKLVKKGKKSSMTAMDWAMANDEDELKQLLLRIETDNIDLACNGSEKRQLSPTDTFGDKIIPKKREDGVRFAFR